jgi:hypothetical protein
MWVLTTRHVPCFFRFQSQSVGSCDKHNYEISKEANLLALRSSLIESEKHRAEIARNRARNAQLSICRLPDEVLREIFILAASPIDVHLWKSAFLTTCHHWRKCAVHCPPLWSTVPIGYRTELDELGVWLSRSASAPLRVGFRYSGKDGLPEQIMAHFKAAYEVILGHGSRVRSMLISGIPSIATLVPLEFPADSLRMLHLRWDGSERPSTPLPVVGCDVSRTLRSLYVRGTWPCRNAVHIDNLRSSNLTSLLINQAVNRDSVCEILPTCRSLERLQWHYTDEASSALEKRSMDPFSLPKLWELFLSGSVSVPLIEACEMPELLTLSVTAPHRPMRDIVPHLIRWHTISELELCFVPVARDEDFVSIFQNLQELECFSCNTWTTSTLRSLRILNEYFDDCEDGTRQLYCPLLGKLTIDGVARWNAEPKLLEDTLTRYLKPLLRKRGAEYDEPLTVYLPRIGEFDGLRGVDGIRFEQNSP